MNEASGLSGSSHPISWTALFFVNGAVGLYVFNSRRTPGILKALARSTPPSCAMSCRAIKPPSLSMDENPERSKIASTKSPTGKALMDADVSEASITRPTLSGSLETAWHERRYSPTVDAFIKDGHKAGVTGVPAMGWPNRRAIVGLMPPDELVLRLRNEVPERIRE